jgi:hypothetical protein
MPSAISSVQQTRERLTPVARMVAVLAKPVVVKAEALHEGYMQVYMAATQGGHLVVSVPDRPDVPEARNAWIGLADQFRFQQENLLWAARA